jgi:hypothetical protein
MLQSLALCCRLPTVAIPHCKWLSTAMLLPSKWLPLCCTDLLAVKLPAVNCPPNNCQPSLPAEKALPADRPRLIYSCSLATPLLPAHWPSPADYRPATSAAAQPIRPLPLYTHVNSFERYIISNTYSIFDVTSVNYCILFWMLEVGTYYSKLSISIG